MMLPVRDTSRQTAALLLLLAREHLTEAEQVTARKLASDLEDWPAFMNAAQHLRGLSFVHKHVTQLGLLPPDRHLIQNWLADTVTRASFRWLSIAQAQARLLDTCILPLDVPHVFLKGLTLSSYYDAPSLRTSRDIDLLVEPAAVNHILEAAQDAGYQVLLDPKSARFVESSADLEAVLALKEDIPLLSPEGVVVEVHRSLHEDLPDASIDAVIAAAEDSEIGDRTYKVLPTSVMFPYLCAHHTRHLWDTPNYVADIAAVRSHPSWDEAEVFDWATRFRLKHVVQAALEFETATRTGTLPNKGMSGRYAACFALHVEGQAETHDMLEQELKVVNRWVHRIDASFAETWKVFLRQFSPTLLDYVHHRVPVHKKLFYWALGIGKIVSKSSRRLLHLGAR